MTTTRKATIATPSEREIHTERIFDAPRDRVWRALTDPAQIAQWWGRGNKLVIEKLDVRRGGHWRFVEHAPEGTHGFEGRYREVDPPNRVVQTFEWDGMPGHVIVETMTLEDLGDGRTKLVTLSLFHTTEERDGMLQSGMEDGMNESYAALDRLLGQPETTAKPPASVRKVAFTMYPVTDVARARAFYEQTLGLAVGMAGGREGKYWIEYDLPGGGCLALTNTTGDQPSAAAGGTVALEVSDLPSMMDRLKTQGVTFKSDIIKGPHCRMAVCLDSEGNSLLLHQVDRKPS
ncbi:MAG TPA: SRPBCC domain-containing protein [Haliangiales bacterium]|nr:SRPBCC domain-containing protein [Haliangiales bacterium]